MSHTQRNTIMQTQ